MNCFPRFRCRPDCQQPQNVFHARIDRLILHASVNEPYNIHYAHFILLRSKKRGIAPLEREQKLAERASIKRFMRKAPRGKPRSVALSLKSDKFIGHSCRVFVLRILLAGAAYKHTARAHGDQQSLGIGYAQDEMNALRRLLKYLQRSVLRLLVHGVGVF